ncbi:MAG: SCO family protein [Magnetospirillum sp.]|nr:MAG: SCO family protein [Magnetospirillum sp.]
MEVRINLGILLGTVLITLILAVGTARAEPIGGPFSLTGPGGRTVSDSDFRGHWLLIYFGYTSCPDACPTDLQRMADALEALGDLAPQVQPIFITLDPARDTPAVLAEHVALFHPRLIGLSGTPAQIDEVARRYRVRFVRNPPDPNGRYGVDHSTNIVLMTPAGQFAEWYKAAVPARTMAEAIKRRIVGANPG